MPVDARLPCSSLQHQLLLHQMLQPESTAYNEPVSIFVEPYLAESTARAALQMLVRRHAVLRTYFALDACDSAFYQIILPADGSSVPSACCSAPESWGEELDHELRTPFDLSAAPPIRAIMLQAEPPRLVINVHHVAADMEAMATMHVELAAHCAALSLHRPPPSLAPLEVAVWLQMGTDETKANPAIKAATNVNASAEVEVTVMAGEDAKPGDNGLTFPEFLEALCALALGRANPKLGQVGHNDECDNPLPDCLASLLTSQILTNAAQRVQRAFARMDLVLFNQAMEHVSPHLAHHRQRRAATRCSSASAARASSRSRASPPSSAACEVFQVKLTSSYGVADFKADLQRRST